MSKYLKTATIAIVAIGVILAIVGHVTQDVAAAQAGITLALIFGILRGLLSVTRLF